MLSSHCDSTDGIIQTAKSIRTTASVLSRYMGALPIENDNLAMKVNVWFLFR